MKEIRDPKDIDHRVWLLESLKGNNEDGWGRTFSIEDTSCGVGTAQNANNMLHDACAHVTVITFCFKGTRSLVKLPLHAWHAKERTEEKQIRLKPLLNKTSENDFS